MHGIIMNQLRQYVIARHGRAAWPQLAESAGVSAEVPRVGDIYPDEQLLALVATACRQTGTPLNVLLEDFGHFIAPALLRVYQPLIPSTWRTLDVIQNTEETIHTVVRMRNPGAHPPALLTRRTSPNEVEIDYRSPRRLCSVAKGIARGMGTHFDEPVTITEPECMHRGAPRCLIVVRTESAEGAGAGA